MIVTGPVPAAKASATFGPAKVKFECAFKKRDEHGARAARRAPDE
jgi:hypothetical protein